ncbi:MAG: DUF2442 domain-containing protein [Breznakibacter sp.]|nr:DUF2442 domain-containing protein [Breznakibacter sp.]
METVIDVKALDNYTVMVIFDDNFKATINIKPFITTGISSKLLDNAYFKQVKVDEFGGIAWDNGFDFCPNYLRELAQKG